MISKSSQLKHENKLYNDMKEIIDVINEEKVNESALFTLSDVSLIVVISTALSYMISMGCRITGNMIQQMIASNIRDKHGEPKRDALQELKNFTRSLDIDVKDLPQITSVLNNPGEWSTEMLSELRNAFFDKLTPEQLKEYKRLESNYIKERNRFVRFK